jgi:hypothetical protein
VFSRFVSICFLKSDQFLSKTSAIAPQTLLLLLLDEEMKGLGEMNGELEDLVDSIVDSLYDSLELCLGPPA